MGLRISEFVDKLLSFRHSLLQLTIRRQEVELYNVQSESHSAGGLAPGHESHLGYEIEKTVVNEQLRLEFHPQFEIRRGRLIGLEALLRLDSELLQHVPPAIFIPLMEKNRLIHQVGEWVIETVCRQRREWHDSGVLAPDCRIAINISACQFSNNSLNILLGALLEKYRISASMLEFEITESVLLENTAAIRAQLQELRERGFGLAVDDFGTGYSSLAYLKQFHVDSLKIDQMFIRQITTSHKDVAIAAAMIKLAHRLGLKTVAEGVETGEQLSILHRLDCDMVQGHLFSQPLPPEQVTEFVLWWRSANSAQRGWIPKLTSV